MAATLPEIRSQAEQKMLKSLEALKVSLAKIRTGRAHAGLLDHIQVDYYGSMVPISQVANVTLVDARTIGRVGRVKCGYVGHERNGRQASAGGHLFRLFTKVRILVSCMNYSLSSRRIKMGARTRSAGKAFSWNARSETSLT
jgi:hypothetical protein